jgi:hypothetical protein
MLFLDRSFLLRNRDNKYLKYCIDNSRTICSCVVMHFRWDRKAYDYGLRQNQLTVASDLIFHF